MDKAILHKCPNCGFQNKVTAIVCKACGINLQVYDRYNEEISLVLDQQQNDEIFKKQVVFKKEEITKAYRRVFTKQLIGMIILMGCLVFITYWSINFYQNWKTERNQQALEYYKVAKSCYNEMDYQCAIQQSVNSLKINSNQREVERLLMSAYYQMSNQALQFAYFENAKDYSKACLSVDSENYECKNLLCNIDLAFADQLIMTHDWEKAITTLDEAKSFCPNDDLVVLPLITAYDGWLSEVTEQDNLLMIIRVKLLKQRSLSRFNYD